MALKHCSPAPSTRGRFICSLTDVVMPQMSGPEVSESWRRSVGSQVLYMSGYPTIGLLKGGIDTEHSSQKPFTPTTLAQKFVGWMSKVSWIA